MKSCIHCKNKAVCSLYEDNQKNISDGLKKQVLVPSNTNSNSSSTLATLAALARGCTLFTPYYDLDKILNEKEKDSLKNIAKKLKKDSDFVDEFLNQISPEHRSDLVSSYIDEDEILLIIKKHKNCDDLIEDCLNLILSEFGL